MSGNRTLMTGVVVMACLLLAVFAFRLKDSAGKNGLTFDEPHYVGTGLYLWDSGDYHYAHSLYFHPPLAYHLASLALLTLDLDDIPRSRETGRHLLSGREPPPSQVRLLSRLPFIALACWGALLIFLWAKEVAGGAAGLFALALFTASPIMLAHSSLAHSDIPVAVFFLQTLYTFWRWRQKPGFLRLGLCGLSLGLALIAKLNGLILLPTLGLLLLAHEFRVWPIAKRDGELALDGMVSAGFFRSGLRATSALAILIGFSACVLWAGYGFSFALQEVEGGSLEGMSLPAYMHSLIFDVKANAQTRSIYFFGEIGGGGDFWYLLPVAWLLKTPLAFLLLIALALILPSEESRSSGRRLNFLIVVALAVYLGVVIFWLRVPLGVRYLLPMLPLLHLFVATRLAPFRGRRGLAAGMLLAWMWAAGAWIHPHYLAFFNPLVGGPTHAHKALVESNYDWGQALPALADELERRGNPPLWLAYFGGDSPVNYGINGRKLRDCRPVSGMLAISATLLRGVYGLQNPFRAAPEGCFDWLLEYEPVAQPGHAILLYEIPEP